MRLASVLGSLTLLAGCLLANAGSACAQPGDSSAWGPYSKPSLRVERRTGPIAIDGDLADEGWRSVTRVQAFTESLPDPGKPPHARTEAMITYDDEFLYVGMIGYDKDPRSIRSSMSERDNIWQDDFMGIILDTYGDATRAYEIYANPRGIQGDLLWTASNEDGSFDMLYQSEAQITDSGWQLELKIPLSSLRFPDRPVQDWHISFWRNHPREYDYKYSWAPISFFVPCAFCQLGTLTGIENIHAGGGLELLPAIVAHANAEQQSADQPLRSDPFKIAPSLGIKYFAGPNATLEAAIAPDFSQVEADATQVSANTKFALYYPERRPFFEEGNDLFQTYYQDVYTRSINDPLVVAKAIYRDGPNNLGYLGGFDRTSPVIIPLEEQSVVLTSGRSLSNIVRASKNLKEGDFVGVIATDRRYESHGTIDGKASNTTFGFDTHLTLGNNVEILAQALGSNTQEPNDSSLVSPITFDRGKHTVTYDGEHYLGYLFFTAIQRFTRGLDLHVDYNEVNPTFRAGNGFIFNDDYRSASAWAGYKQPLKSRWIQELDGGIAGSLTWNFIGERKQEAVRPFLDASLPGQTDLHVYYRMWNEQYHDVQFTGLSAFRFSASTRFNPYVQFGFDATTGRDIARDLLVPEKGNAWIWNAWMDLKPCSSLLVQPTFAYSRLDSLDGSGSYFAVAIYRVKASYQFTRQFSVRFIGEYDSQDRVVKIDPLLTYKINPFTVFYLGSTHNFYAESENARFQPSERQFFAKIQYLLQGLG